MTKEELKQEAEEYVCKRKRGKRMSNKKCKYAENKSGDIYECNGYKKVDCPFMRRDYNPDGSVNIFICDYVEHSEVEK